MTATTPITTITDISDRAMLVNVHISMFSATKTDKKITAEVAQQHGSDENMGRYAKNLVAKGAMDKLKRLAAGIREEHYKRTLPWAEDGARILTSVGYLAYAEWIRKQENEFWTAVDEFASQWSSFVADARVKLNGLFDASDYPTEGELRRRFGFRWQVRPVPAAGDFRVALGADEVSAIKAGIQAEQQATIDAAMRDVWGRMRDVVGKMAERLKLYDPNKPSDAPFRDTLVTNIGDLLDMVPSLNLTGDSTVNAFANAMRQSLTKFSAQDLRDKDWARVDTAAAAQSILDQMSQFV